MCPLPHAWFMCVPRSSVLDITPVLVTRPLPVMCRRRSMFRLRVTAMVTTLITGMGPAAATMIAIVDRAVGERWSHLMPKTAPADAAAVFLSAAFWGSFAQPQVEVRKVVGHTVVSPVLQVDLGDSRMLVVTRRKNLRRFAGKENPGVSTVTVNEPADDNHGFEVSGKL